MNNCNQSSNGFINLSVRVDDITKCKTAEEVNYVLSEIASEANKSIANALKAQIQVVKYISSPELYGSTFDLFFKNLSKAIENADKDQEDEIKEKAGLILNNFVFFMTAKIKYEFESNRVEGQKLLEMAAQGFAETTVDLLAMYYGGAPSIMMKTNAVKKISECFLTRDESGDNSLLTRFVRWASKGIRAEKKKSEFYTSLDLLASKLVDYQEVIGKNNLISGIFENHYAELLENHSSEWAPYIYSASEYKTKAWKIPCFILGIGTVIGSAIWFIRLVILWIKGWFTEVSPGWAQTQWMWTGIICGGLSLGLAILFLILSVVNTRKANKEYASYCEYYDAVIDLFKE